MTDSLAGDDSTRTERGKVVVVGQGYVGLPVAIEANKVGWNVVGFDIDEPRVGRLRSADSPVEDISNAALRAALDSGRYVPSCDPADLDEFDIAVVTVPTPLSEGLPDLSFIEASALTLGEYLRPGATVILESTTYPGTTTQLFGPLLGEASGLTVGVDFHLGYSPERIDPGNPRFGLTNTPKVVSGIDPASAAIVADFYGSFVETVIPVNSTEVAEMTKLLENTFRHVNIALVNELAMFAHDLEIDVWEAIDAASSKPFGYMRFVPGPGVGGHCLPIDPTYLGWQVRRKLGTTFRFVELANDVNEHMPDYVVSRVIAAMNDRSLAVRGRRLVLAGLAYKPNTSDARESPAKVIAEKLHQLGAQLIVCDPHLPAHQFDERWERIGADELASACADSDGAILLVNHDEFLPSGETPSPLLAAPWVFDTRRCLPAADHIESL